MHNQERLSNEISYNQAMIIDREKGIQEMQNTMNEISEILKDVGIIVVEQGNMLGTASCLVCFTKTCRQH